MRSLFRRLGDFVAASRQGPRPYRPLLESLEDRCLLSGYQENKLVSDQIGKASHQDHNLVNAWGLAAGQTGPWWVADNGPGLSTTYDGMGNPQPTVVGIPPAPGSPPMTPGTPTGTVWNPSPGFVVMAQGHSGPAIFLFATEDGTISGWNPMVDPNHAILAVNNNPGGAVYKGLATGNPGPGPVLYAANFRAGTVDVFDQNFHPIHLSGSFSDPNLPPGYAPFGIQAMGNTVYVTYALQDAAKHDDVPGAHHGFVDAYDPNGNLVKRLVSGGPLNSPWGVALAPPQGFGNFSGDLLVGNFGNGRINAFDPNTGHFLGSLTDSTGKALVISGLWGLEFGNGDIAGPPNVLFFTAGPGKEAHGLFGSLQAAGPLFVLPIHNGSLVGTQQAPVSFDVRQATPPAVGTDQGSTQALGTGSTPVAGSLAATASSSARKTEAASVGVLDSLFSRG